MKMNDNLSIQQEAEIFGYYIVKQVPDEKIAKRYEHIVSATAPATISHQDKIILQFICKNPKFIGVIDSYLALFRSNSEVRRKLFVMFSILESSPKYTSYFLPFHHSKSGWLTVATAVIRNMFRLLGGVIIIKFVERKYGSSI